MIATVTLTATSPARPALVRPERVRVYLTHAGGWTTAPAHLPAPRDARRCLGVFERFASGRAEFSLRRVEGDR